MSTRRQKQKAMEISISGKASGKLLLLPTPFDPGIAI